MITNKILELRKKRGLNQEELAERMNVSRQTISNWELGVTIPNLKESMDLSKILEVSIDEIACNAEYISQYEDNYLEKIWKKSIKIINDKFDYELLKISHVVNLDKNNNLLIEFPMPKTAKEMKEKYGKVLLEEIRKNCEKEITEIYFLATEYYHY